MNATRFTRAALAAAAVAALSLTGVTTASALTPAGPGFDPDLDLQIPQPDPCDLIIDLCDPGDDVPEDDEPECPEVDDCLSIPEDDDTPGEETPDEEPDPEVLDETDVNPDVPVRANPNFTG